MDLSPAPSMRMSAHEHHSGALSRTLLIGLIAFLTVIDLFGTQAILPMLTQAYGVTPAAMSFAVNATTMGMAVAGLGVAYFSRHIDRRRGILIAMTLLALPTALLAIAPNLAVFTVLRIAQGLCMAAADPPHARDRPHRPAVQGRSHCPTAQRPRRKRSLITPHEPSRVMLTTTHARVSA